MTEIEKLFENANAYKMLCNCEFKNLYDYRIEYGSDVCDYTESKIKEPCNICKKAKQKIKYYPDFTAEKQLAILKLLTQQCDLTISYFTKWKWEFVCYDGQEPLQVRGKDFAETFAKLINAYWQDLTEKEKEEIRNILNDRD